MPEQPLGRICITHSEKVTCDQTYCAVGETWRTAQALLNRDYCIYWPTIGARVLVIPCSLYCFARRVEVWKPVLVMPEHHPCSQYLYM